MIIVRRYLKHVILLFIIYQSAGNKPKLQTHGGDGRGAGRLRRLRVHQPHGGGEEQVIKHDKQHYRADTRESEPSYLTLPVYRLQLQGELRARGEYVRTYRGPVHGLLVMARSDGLRSLQAGLAPAMMYQVLPAAD